MKQFLKTLMLTILIILTFISCSKNEANAGVHEVGDDEEWTEDWDAIAEENSDYKSNQNNFDAFQHLPSVENEPYEFAKNVFMVNEIREVGNNLVNQLAIELNSSSTLQNLLYDVDPNGLVVARLDQYNEKSEKQILYIQRYKSIYDLSEERRLNETLNQEIEKRFDFKSYNGIKINNLLFYNVSLMTIKKNGKGKLIWQNIYTPFRLTYLKSIQTNYRYTNEAWNNLGLYSTERRERENYKAELAKNYVISFLDSWNKTNENKLKLEEIISLHGDNFDSYSFLSHASSVEEGFNKYLRDNYMYPNVDTIERINIYDFTFESQMIDEILDKYVNWTYYNKKPK